MPSLSNSNDDIIIPIAEKSLQPDKDISVCPIDNNYYIPFKILLPFMRFNV